jgi:hypothetical protein
MVLVSLPRSFGGGFSGGSFRVGSRDGLRVRLEGDAARSPVPAGVPVVVRYGDQRLLGAVVAHPEPHVLEVALKAPAELRRHDRYPLRLGVELDLVDDPDGMQLSCAAIDVSVGGVKLHVGTRIPQGALAFVVLQLPGVSPAMAVGEVLDCTMQPYENAYTVRVQFTCITRDNIERITAFLGSLDGAPRAIDSVSQPRVG